MIEIRSYSIDELEELTGFNQRTIAYYIQQGLLPKVGRRGRSTRYPQLFVDRLKFIQRVRDLQDSGRLGSVTLPRIARVVWYLIEQSGGSQELPELADGEIQRLFDVEAIPDERVLGETEDGQRVTVTFGKFGPYVRAGQETASIDAEDFNSITPDDAVQLIAEKTATKELRLIKEFKEANIQVLDGRFGPYVRGNGINAKIPKSMDPTRLMVEDCEELLQKRQDKLARKSASKRKDRLLARREARDTTAAYAPTKSFYSIEDNVFFEQSLGMIINNDIADLQSDIHESDIQSLVLQIEARALKRAREQGRQIEYWTREPLSEHIEISVRGIEPNDADLVELLAKSIRKLLVAD